MKYILFLLIGIVISGPVFAEFRIWEDMSGNIWEGEFVTMSGDKVIVRDHSGEKKEYLPDQLCENDRVYLEKMVPPRLSLDVSKTSDSGSSGKTERVKCRAVIKKTDTASYKGELTAVLVMLAKDQKTGSFSKAGSSKEFKFFLPEKHGTAVEFESADVKLLKSSAKSGKIYAGYILVVWDRFGNAVGIESNRDSFLERASKIARPRPTLK